MVGMRHGEQCFLNLPGSHPVRPVFVGLPALVFHNVPLDIKPLLVHRVQEKAHAVGLQP